MAAPPSLTAPALHPLQPFTQAYKDGQTLRELGFCCPHNPLANEAECKKVTSHPKQSAKPRPCINSNIIRSPFFQIPNNAHSK
jgi:hypothetical protein